MPLPKVDSDASKKERQRLASEIISELMDSWKETGKIGNARPQTKAEALRMATRIAMERTGQSRTKADSKAGDSKGGKAKMSIQPTSDLSPDLAPACFEADLPESGDESGEVVVRVGKIFEAGHYPDKQFSLTPAELAAAAASFEPVNANYEHRPGPLDGHLGALVGVAVSDDGRELIGSFAEPRWMTEVLQGAQRKVSLEWDRNSKRIAGIAHCINPRISDAALFHGYTMFSEENDETNNDDSNAAEFGYESASERDAIPDADYGDPENKLFPVRTQSEFREAMRELWNAADPTAVKKRIMAIAKRKGLDTKDTQWWMTTAGVSRPIGEQTGSIASYSQAASHSQQTDKERKAMNPTTPETTPENKSFAERFLDFFRGAKPEEIAAFAQSVNGQAGHGQPAKTQRELDLEKQLAAFHAEQAQKRLDEISAQAKAAADRLVAEKRIVAVGNEDYNRAVAAFTVAAHVDAMRQEKEPALACFASQPGSNQANPLANFSLTEHLQALYAKLPAHTKNAEQVGALTKAHFAEGEAKGEAKPEEKPREENGHVALFDQETTTVVDAETGDLKKYTETQVDAILAARNGVPANGAPANGVPAKS